MKKKKEKNGQPDVDTLNRECFWEYCMSNAELLEMAQHGTDQEKFFLFCKILENSQDVLQSLNIFSSGDQKKMLSRYSPPKFNRHFLEKRYKILLYFISGQEVDIPELRWNT